ncbi:hypothetical protein CDD83_6884 [Cordyceps sp. RAO-2017]|nr:hypothetical protein CDD83_6884 [Cordyceps sp. RAO-2017]
MDALPGLHRLASRHIQNHSDADNVEPHWGYPDRVVPCKNDAGSCAYLDTVYRAHDLGMLYVGILWATILGILLLWVCLRHAGRPAGLVAGTPSRSGLDRARSALAALRRRHLLPDASRRLFGRTTRLQVLVLAILAGYLLVWSFVGIAYNSWVTPVKNQPGVFNTRTGLGPWSDRVGVLAYALTPLSVLLASRESLLSVLTGLPYQTFNFLHRWLGYIIFVQGSLHTIGWCIIQLRLYQPQPKVGLEWVVQTYIVWGLVAMILLTLLFILSTPWAIRRTGYEFFRKAHYVLAMVYIGACWGHWDKLKCFLIPSLILWGLDRGARLVRTALLHYHPWAASKFSPVKAAMTRFTDDQDGDVIRLDFTLEQDPWAVGQHFYLCFVECSVWQSHPFTPLNAPVLQGGHVRHSYIVRAKAGETKKLARLAAGKLPSSDPSKTTSAAPTTPVILTGPYGEDLMSSISAGNAGFNSNIICIAGGTGIAYVMPVLLQLARRHPVPDRKIELIWAMRHQSNVEWIQEEMECLQRAQKTLNLTIRLYATRDSKIPAAEKGASTAKDHELGSASSSSDGICACDDGVSVHKTGDGETGSDRHPNLRELVGEFVESTITGRTTVFASGPGGMITDLRATVAALNCPSKVLKGRERFIVELVCDDRLEW